MIYVTDTFLPTDWFRVVPQDEEMTELRLKFRDLRKAHGKLSEWLRQIEEAIDDSGMIGPPEFHFHIPRVPPLEEHAASS